MTSSFVFNTARLLILICTVCFAVQPAAADTPSISELQQTIAALEARVSALEAQVQRHSGVGGQAEQASQPIALPVLASLSPQIAPLPMELGRPEREVELQPADNGWSGFYLGTSFGLGVASSKGRYRDVSKSIRTQTETENSTDFDNDGTSSLSKTISTDFQEDEDLITGTSLTSHHIGALEDLYLGANFHPTPRTLLGVQVEGSLAEMSFGTKFRQQNETFARTNTNTFTNSSTDGSSNQSNNSRSVEGSEVNQFPFIAQAKLDWMTSVIGRAGWLATPNTLLYGLGGWSYGRFELDSYELGLSKVDDYGAQGFTVGGGIEQKLSRNWSLRAEYRYTNFGDKEISARDRGTDTQSESGPAQNSNSNVFDGETFANSSVGTSKQITNEVDSNSSIGHIEGDMQVGRIGFTRYFGGGS